MSPQLLGSHQLTMSSYRYSELTSPRCTRLIRLHGSPVPSDPLAFNLEEMLLDKPDKSYDALSYTWGGQPCDRPVSVLTVGTAGTSELMITANAEAALRHLRDKDRKKARYLWVDAICIDQSSIPERNVQVANMGDIYRGAKRVLIWLGEGTADTRAAFLAMAGWWRLLYTLHPRGLAHSFWTWVTVGEESGRDFIQRRMGSGMTIDHGLQVARGLDVLVSHSYWERVWTLQEIGLSKDPERCLVLCGASTEPVNLLILYETVAALHFNRNLLDRISVHFNLALREAALAVKGKERRRNSKQKYYGKEGFLSNGKYLDIFSMLSEMRAKNATEPRDYIYGLRELFPEDLKLVAVSYERPTADIYREVTQHIIERKRRDSAVNDSDDDDKTLDGILVHASQEQKTVTDCPSWVPDWSSVSVPEAARGQYTQYNKWVNRASACRRTKARCQFRSHPPGGILVLTGREVTTVGADISAKFPPGVYPPSLAFENARRPERYAQESDDEFVDYGAGPVKKVPGRREVVERNGREMLRILEEWVVHIETITDLARRGIRAPREQMARLLWEVTGPVVRDSSYTDSDTFESDLRRRWLPELKHRGAAAMYPEFLRERGQSDSWLYVWHRNLAYALDGQRLFVAADGRLGLGLNVEQGDIVTVLAGCHSPVVLRKGVDGERYRLVGHCFLIGAAYGEEWPDNEALLREFEIV
ncbi:heterokaryon incompatibility protein-domain-containing protein [Bombardia bombarda]|uniref:Heterokaryon incompatibility protein-domain-containing protein n=1 Tax=Bombardia bombarda TaxID=252184 RepID=A0AA39XM24_9PEZI|nr:heterokaryon incompatibility protein-domain-containing protein [Bombardia bombarda]